MKKVLASTLFGLAGSAALAQPTPTQGVDQPVHAGVQLRPGPGSTLVDQRHLVGTRLDAAGPGIGSRGLGIERVWLTGNGDRL